MQDEDASTEAGGPSGPREAWRSLRAVAGRPALRRLLGGQALFLVAFWSSSAPLAVYVYDRGGAALLGVAAVARTVPAALGAPVLAVVVDRFPRRAVLLVTTLVCSALLGAVAAAVVGGAPAGAVIVLSATAILASTVFEPARQALLPALAGDTRELAAANVIGSTVDSVAFFAGPALGGALLAVGGVDLAVVAAPVLMACCLLPLARLPHAEAAADAAGAAEGDGDRDGAGAGGPLAELSAGFRAVAGLPDVRLLVGLMSVQVLVDGIAAVLVTLAALELLDLGQPGVGVLNALLGAGGFLGVGAALLLGATRLGTVFAAGLALFGIPFLLVGAVPEPALAFVLLLGVGVGNTLIDTSGLTLLQRATPDAVRGRVFGVMEGALWGAFALGSALAPLLDELLGVRGALIAGGAILPVAALLVLPRLRAIDAGPPAPAADALAVLRRQPFLRALPFPALEALAGQAAVVQAPAGTVVIRQGDAADRWYAVASGELDVAVDGRRVGTLGADDGFGEIGLLRQVPRTATVTARTAARLVALDAPAFIAALAGDPRAREGVDAMAGARLAHAGPEWLGR